MQIDYFTEEGDHGLIEASNNARRTNKISPIKNMQMYSSASQATPPSSCIKDLLARAKASPC
jgi:hypothetical protein